MNLSDKAKEMANGASNFFQKLKNAFEKTKVGWESGYPLVLLLPPNGISTQNSFYVSGQGDFILEYLTGKIYAYDPSTLVIDTTVKTGVTFNINESGNNRDIFQSSLNAENILTPGYGDTIYEKWNMRDYHLKSTTTVRVTAYNSNASKAQALILWFGGHQANGSVA